MTFKFLLSQYGFDEIAPVFRALWEQNAPEQAKHLNMEGWRKIYQSLQSLEAVPSQYYIQLVCRWESCSPMVDMNCSVYGKDNHCRYDSMSSYPSWAEVMGMEIIVDEDVQITPQELTAGLLWEITYYGGTEEMSRKNQERIFHRNKGGE